MKTRKLYDMKSLQQIISLSRWHGKIQLEMPSSCYVTSHFTLISKYWNQSTINLTICTPAMSTRHPNI